MQLFAEATDLLQAEKKPAFASVIPIINSLENTLLSMERETPVINALFETLLNSLQHHFSHLPESKTHQSATALKTAHPVISSLSFIRTSTNNTSTSCSYYYHLFFDNYFTTVTL